MFAANSGSVSFHTARSAADFSPARSNASKICQKMITDGSHRDFKARISSATSIWSRG